jgi:hypothetical protein
VLTQALQRARAQPGAWHMSTRSADPSGQRHVAIARVTPNRADVAVAAVLDLEQGVRTLLGANPRSGLDLDLRLQPAERERAYDVRLSGATGKPALVLDEVLHTAQATLALHWRVAQDFGGGVDKTLAYAVWVVGSLLSLMVALYVASLRNKNARIQQRVDAATQELQAANRPDRVAQQRDPAAPYPGHQPAGHCGGGARCGPHG